ncbi:MAG: hypothetical protein AB7S75_23815 [Desulfococcaceae bacterium]
MKRKIFVCLSLLSAFLTCFSCRAADSRKPEIAPSPGLRAMQFAGAEIVRADEEVQAFLGAEILSAIERADRMETYRLGPPRNPDKTGLIIQGYPVISRGRDLKGGDMESLRRMLYSASSYEFQWSKRTRIRPSHAIRVIGRGEHLDIAIDFNSHQWCFSFRGTQKEEDISKTAAPTLHEMMNKAFGNK